MLDINVLKEILLRCFLEDFPEKMEPALLNKKLKLVNQFFYRFWTLDFLDDLFVNQGQVNSEELTPYFPPLLVNSFSQRVISELEIRFRLDHYTSRLQFDDVQNNKKFSLARNELVSYAKSVIDSLQATYKVAEYGEKINSTELSFLPPLERDSLQLPNDLNVESFLEANLWIIPFYLFFALGLHTDFSNILADRGSLSPA